MEQPPSGFKLRRPLGLDSLRITGERILLRPVGARDAEDILREFTAEITRYMYPDPAREMDQVEEFLARMETGLREGTDLAFAVLRKETEEFLGCCGLHSCNLPETPALGIWIKKSAHGHRFGREAVTLLVDWASREVDFDHLLYPVDRANIPSRKIPESLGGRQIREGRTRRMNGEFLDEIVYRIEPRVASPEPPSSAKQRPG